MSSSSEAKLPAEAASTKSTIFDGIEKIAPSELIRGTTPADIEKRCLELCQTYIAGSWSNAKSTADLTVKRISGGFTNQLYHVHLNETVERVSNAIYPEEPADVAIKFYQEKHVKNYNQEDGERLNDIIVLTIISQTGLGPKVYGIFGDGCILGFYKHEQFRSKHQQKPSLRRAVFHLLARLNNLNVPIRKERNLLFSEMRNMIVFSYEHNQVNELAIELDLKLFKQYNLLNEYEELMNRIERLNAPDVFTHHDFRGSNLLVTEDGRILVCDLEYCGYATRGFDLACIITEWGKKDLFDWSNVMPSDEVIQELVKLYVEECDKVVPGYAAKPGNSIEQHLAEVRIMLLVNRLFFVSWMVKQTESLVPAQVFDRKKQMEYSEIRLQEYFDYKNELLQKGLIS